jgi:site-specific recombinase XerC
MNQLAPLPSPSLALPALIASADERARLRFLEFFAVTIRNPHTRRAYARAAGEFLAWVAARGITSLAGLQPLHVAAWIEALGREVSAPTVKQQLAAVRHLFDWLVTGQVMPTNPAASVRGPAHSVRRGKTPVLAADEARRLLDGPVGPKLRFWSSWRTRRERAGCC